MSTQLPWLSSSAPPPDVHIRIHDVSFHLNKECMSSRSATLSKLLQTNNYIDLSIFTDIPATVAVEAFRLVAIFSYNHPPPLTSDNIIPVACLAAFLSMTEDHSPNNLLKFTLSSFSSQILPNWNSTIKAFKSTEPLISHAQKLGLIDACLNSISSKAFADPSLLDTPYPVDTKPLACRRLFSLLLLLFLLQ
ncbi:BTB/POZ domain-containing protein At5g03250-like [Dioscorea cayenensis subsp. rotundata]|uniref:BTB/POZ domain-containing protein At5g03250-like n=1 Tax=Dioscorea cayennensis subsp. rotundata TaxID=55577 RepID=A0AB40B868_DIOCR|nr:BTB/POZ domain-containing protein At5g03250-like [Dioscorea cayenensis subsp. rotundata]